MGYGLGYGGIRRFYSHADVEGAGGGMKKRDKETSRFGDVAADVLLRAASCYPGVKTVLAVDKYTGDTLRNTASSVIGESASNAVNLGGAVLDAVGASSAQKGYDLSDRLYRESQDSLNDALKGKSEWGQGIVRTGAGLGRAGGQAVADLAVPGLGTALRVVDEAGRASREYRQAGTTAYDPAKALTRGAASGLGVAAGGALAKGVNGLLPDAPYSSMLQSLLGSQPFRQAASGGTHALTEAAFDEAGRALTEDGYSPDWKRVGEKGAEAFAFGYVSALLRDTALSARDKAYLQTDLDDAEKSCARALETLSDPNATAKEQERALQSAIDETNWARYRLNEFDPFETQHEVNEAYDELTGILEKLERYKTEAPLPDFAQLDLSSDETVRQNESSFLSWAKEVGIDNTVKTLEEYNAIKYNDPVRFQLLTRYIEDVEAGWISPLATFEDYESLYNRVQNEIVGQTTQNGITITGQVPHFMQRVIGTGVDPQKLQDDLKIVRRSGVEFDDIKDALLYPIRTGAVTVKESGNRSIVLFGAKCAVSINPDTGKLIQVNPLRGKR